MRLYKVKARSAGVAAARSGWGNQQLRPPNCDELRDCESCESAKTGISLRKRGVFQSPNVL